MYRTARNTFTVCFGEESEACPPATATTPPAGSPCFPRGRTRIRGFHREMPGAAAGTG